jgi:hypothetical protein
MAIKKNNPEPPKEPEIKINPNQYTHPIGPVRPGEKIEA